MKIIGCDFHPGRQQVAVFDSGSGEIEERVLDHASGEAERFYRELEFPALIGMEAVGNSLWFERLVAKLGVQTFLDAPCGDYNWFRTIQWSQPLASYIGGDIVPATGELWGNYPQTYSLVGLINSAMKLSKSWEEAS